MSHTGSYGQFTSTPGAAYPGHPAGNSAAAFLSSTPHEGRARVLAHNPFSTMRVSNDGGSEHGTEVRSSSAPLYQRPPVAFATASSLHMNAMPALSAAATTSQGSKPLEQPAPSRHLPQGQGDSHQHHLQPALSPAANPPGFSQRVVENAAAVSPFTTAQVAAPQAVVAENTRFHRSPSAQIMRGPSLNSLPSANSGIELTPGDSTTKRSLYLRNLLKKDPPEFLKPSPGAPARRRSASGQGRASSPFGPMLSRLYANSNAQMAPGPRSYNAGANAEGQQQQQLQDSLSTPCPATPNEGEVGQLSSIEASVPAEQQNNDNNDNANRPSASVFSGDQARVPEAFSTTAPRGSQFFTRSVGVSDTLLPSDSFGASTTEKPVHGSLVGEQQLIFHGMRPQGVGCGERSFPCSELKSQLVEEKGLASNCAPISRIESNGAPGNCGQMDGTQPPLVTRQATALPGEVRNANFLSNGTRVMAGNPPPPPLAPPPVPISKSGEAASLAPQNASGLSAYQGLNTPRNGGIRLQKQLNTFQAIPGIDTVECSPAPHPPSRQESQEGLYGAEGITSVANEVPPAGAYVPCENGEFEHPPQGHQNTFVFTDLPATAVGHNAAEFRSFTEKGGVSRFEQHQNTSVNSNGPQFGISATLPPSSSLTSLAPASSLASLEKPGVLNEKAGVSLGANKHLPARKQQKQQQQRWLNKHLCFALVTSTGRVITLSNVSRPGTFAVMNSRRLVDVFCGRVKDMKCFKIGEEHRKMLQILATSSSSFITNRNNDVHLTSLQEIVKEMTGIFPLFREVLLFVLRDPPPDWRTEGQKSLIKMLATAVAQMPIATGSRPNYPLNSEPPQNSAKGLQKIQQLLCAGERETAVTVALEHHLYSHAIIIAMMCPKKEHYMNVIRAVVEQELDPFSPLAHAYCMFNELPLPPFAPLPLQPSSSSSPAEGKTDEKPSIRSLWLQHAAVLVSNFTKDSADGLIKLGDTLTNDGMIEEAHCCFLLAHLSPMGTPPPGRPLQSKQQHIMDLLRARLGVLGGHYHPNRLRSTFVSPKSTLLTDVLQIFRSHLESRSLASSGEKDKKTLQHGIPVCPERYRAAFHYMQVLWLYEVGMCEEALQLMNDLRRVVVPEPTNASSFTLNQIIFSGVVSSAASGREKPAPPTGRETPVRPMPEENIPPPMPSFLSAAKTSIGSSTGYRSTSALPPPPPPPQQQQQQQLLSSQTSHLLNSSQRTGLQQQQPPAPLPASMQDQQQQQQQQVIPNSPALCKKTDAPSLSGTSKIAPQVSAAAGPVLKGPPPPHFSAQPVPTPAAPSAMQLPEVPAGAERNFAAAERDAHEKLDEPRILSSAPLQQPQPQPQQQSRGRAPEVKRAQEKPSKRSSSLEAITSFFFRRGRSEDKKKDEAKKMIIDTEKPPKFDPATGRYLFEDKEGEEEAERIRAGPPKPSSMAAKSIAAGGAPPSMLRPPTGPAGAPRAGTGAIQRARYVDMFNGT
ncbi:hypothetical protein MOQ_003095 [Trypanosoma cruzi marinkellei]|uniref:Sec16 Sec23-binding domain-containing protein n=1 Tax=Trypanosoma cruzi marinkellei TaxID=85056 RepID=K2N0U6_TRYCR|nr:hypothetical protein MOQ_003095 [Trypanosoma cruzi marinkellei]